MKKTLITIAVLSLALVAGAQDKKAVRAYERDGRTFVQTRSQKSENDRATAFIWRDKQGNEYPIFLHTYVKGEKAGKTTCYVILTSKKTGKEYKYYIPNGEEIAKEIMNETR